MCSDFIMKGYCAIMTNFTIFTLKSCKFKISPAFKVIVTKGV